MPEAFCNDFTLEISEGQLGHLFGQVSGPPTTPFKVQRVLVP